MFWLQYAKTWMQAKFESEKGQGMSEYAMILVLIVLGVAVFLSEGTLLTAINNAFSSVATGISNFTTSFTAPT